MTGEPPVGPSAGPVPAYRESLARDVTRALYGHTEGASEPQVTYDNSFFDIIRPGCIRSAEVVVSRVIEKLGPIESVIDIGCGEGWWANEFQRYGASALGVDSGGFHSPNRAKLREWCELDLVEFDLGRSDCIRELQGNWDLVICLEVAEHLPGWKADELVQLLCSLSDNVLFSAAIPMQGGVGHINEQWPNYWIHKFNALDYIGFEFGTDFWGNPDVEPWYQQNMFIFQKGNSSYQQNCFPVIHPAFWSTRTGAPPA